MEIEKCFICYQMITDPVCDSCYENQIIKWFDHMGFNSKLSGKIISLARKKTYVDSLNKSTCVLCNENSVSLCSYCYVFSVMLSLKKLNISNNQIDLFLHSFNCIDNDK